MVLMLDGNSIYAKCNHGNCGRWTKLTFDIPGVKLDFSKAGMVQRTMPKNFSVGGNYPPKPPPRIPVVIVGD